MRRWAAFRAMSITKRSFKGGFETLADIRAFTEEMTRAVALSESDLFALQLAVDEAATNIIEHAYGNMEPGEIELTIQQTPAKVVITLHDEGRPFDPETVAAYDSDLPLDEMKDRGAGLHLIRNIMDEVRFEFDELEGNTLEMVKLIA